MAMVSPRDFQVNSSAPDSADRPNRKYRLELIHAGAFWFFDQSIRRNMNSFHFLSKSAYWR
jgi:hypothetical protein